LTTKKKTRLFLLTAAAAAIFVSPLLCQQSSVEESKRTMKTYPYSDPNPVANIGSIYPYFRFDGYSLEGSGRDWKTVILENPYVKLWVMPEIGGKLWGAVEKSTDQAFIYFNKVVKFRNIAMRGPWTSGGVEFNFGLIGHAPTTASPVDYLYRTNADGSVSCIIGAMDLPSRTRWHVDIRLPKDKAYIETRCFWFNPTPFHQPLYHWMTAAEDVGEDLRYYYPGSRYIGHGGDAHPWPVLENLRDVSFYKNNNFGSSKSYHILGEYDEHFGGYWHRRDFGYGHWALYDDKPGQKLWIWSLARDGAIWNDLLTDAEGNPQYTEPQTGLMFNQEAASSSLTPFKHAYFEPHSVSRWKELWFPVKGIGGMVDGTPYGTLNVTKKDGQIHIGICALQRVEAPLTVAVGGRTMHSEPLSLTPMDVFETAIPDPGKEGELTVTVGNRLLHYNSNPEANRLSRPAVLEKSFDWETPEGLYIAGEELMRQRRYTEAEGKYRSCLNLDPSHIRSKTRLAEIYYRRAQYEKAGPPAAAVLAVDAYDPGGNFIYAEISRVLGRTADAKEAYGWAARSMEYRSAAYARLADIFVSERDLVRAEEYARRALDYNRYNLAGYTSLAVIHRLGNRRQEAEKVLEELLAIDPLCHTARFERFLWDRDEESLAALKGPIHNEFPHETYLEMAMEYNRMGRREETLKVLEIAPPYPVIDFWLAYLYRNLDQEKSRLYLRKALEASPFLVFPFRQESIPVFEWALSKNDHWKLHYYLGLILWNLGREDEAMRDFEACGNTPDFMPFYLCRGRFYIERDLPEKTLEDYRTAVKMTPEDWRAAHMLCDYYLSTGRNDEALGIAEGISGKYPENYILAMDYARALLQADRYRDCVRILAEANILPYEGAREGHDVYRQAHLLQAALELAGERPGAALQSASKAREWPENLGVGRPYDVDERLEDYLTALAHEAMGDRDRAYKVFQGIVDLTKKKRTSWEAAHLMALFALKKTGRQEEAAALLSEWKTMEGPDNPSLRFAQAVLSGNRKEIQTFHKEVAFRDRNLTLLMRLVKIIDF
jgi:tetratricopeptide (TPR) repeat protein